MYEFRKASNDFKFQMEEELRNAEAADRQKKDEEERQRQLAANPPAQLEGTVASASETPAPESTYPAVSSYSQITEEHQRTAALYPSIQPPSTGEPVPAAWTEAAEAAAETTATAPGEEAAEEKENAVIETAVEDTNKATEPAHNG